MEPVVSAPSGAHHHRSQARRVSGVKLPLRGSRHALRRAFANASSGAAGRAALVS
jgi:hypothetical protein